MKEIISPKKVIETETDIFTGKLFNSLRESGAAREFLKQHYVPLIVHDGKEIIFSNIDEILSDVEIKKKAKSLKELEYYHTATQLSKFKQLFTEYLSSKATDINVGYSTQLAGLFAKLNPMITKISEHNTAIYFNHSTDKQKYIKVLRDLEQQYRLIVENANDAILIIQKGKIVFANHKAEQISGFKDDKLIGAHYTSFLLPEQHEMVQKFYKERSKGLREQDSINIRIVKQDGTVTWMELKIHLIVWNGTTATLNYFTEIEEKLKTKSLLIKSEEKYKNLVESNPLPIAVITKTGKFIFLNSAAKILLKLENFRTASLPAFNEFIHPESRDIFHEAANRTSAHNTQHVPFEIIMVKSDKSRFYAEVNILSIDYDNHSAYQIICTDITEKKTSHSVESAIYEISEAAFYTRTLDDLYPEVHRIIKKLMPAKNFYIAFWDKANEMISFPYYIDEKEFGGLPQKLGYEKLGRSLTSYMLHLDKPLLVDGTQFDNLVKKGILELYGENSVEWLGVPLRTPDNETYGAVVVQTYDISEAYSLSDKDVLTFVSKQLSMTIHRKQAESKLIDSEKILKELVASKDMFFSIIAHDLRSPFTAFLGFSEYLSDAAEEEDISLEEVSSISKRMHNSAKSVFELLENLLDWSRIQTNRMVFVRSEVNLTEMVSSVVKLLKHNAIEKRISIKLKTDQKIILFVDENMITTVLRNVLSNAIKFTKFGGKINISSHTEGDYAVITINDNGVGMDKYVAANIFKIDQKTSTLGTAGEKGSGLGLILSREFVEKNGGEISCESKSGEGTTFIIKLPFIGE